MSKLSSVINKFRQKSLTKLKTNKSIGYFCLYVPPELIESYGFIPVRLAGIGDGTSENEGEKFIHNEACSFCKSCLGSKSLKKLPHDKVDYVIIPSTCDQMKRHGEKWHHDFDIKTYHLFVPSTHEDPSCQDIYWQEIKWLSEELKSISKSHKNLKNITTKYNKTRKKLIRLNDILSYSDYFNLMHLFFISSIDDFIKYLNKIETHIKLKTTTPNTTRLMLVGSPIAYRDNFILNMLKKHSHVNIVYDATCTGQRSLEIDIPLSGDMLANISSSYFTRPGCIWQRPNNKFYQYIQKQISKHQVHGIIYKTLKFCDVWKYELKRFKDWSKPPVLAIENTYSDSQDARLNKRISAFLDMINYAKV